MQGRTHLQRQKRKSYSNKNLEYEIQILQKRIREKRNYFLTVKIEKTQDLFPE